MNVDLITFNVDKPSVMLIYIRRGGCRNMPSYYMYLHKKRTKIKRNRLCVKTLVLLSFRFAWAESSSELFSCVCSLRLTLTFSCSSLTTPVSTKLDIKQYWLRHSTFFRSRITRLILPTKDNMVGCCSANFVIGGRD